MEKILREFEKERMMFMKHESRRDVEGEAQAGGG